MNEVLSGYFEDANRGLQRQGPGVASRFANASNVQLPPVGDGGLMSAGKGVVHGGTRDVYSAGARLGKSSSVASLDLSHEKAAIGVQAERYQQALVENEKFSRKVRQLQEQLAITAAKKEAFKAQASKLEKEFKKSSERTDTLQRDLLETRREHEHSSKESREAIDMMNEMRKSHVHEVRLLQRGLAARCGNDQFRNKVNEVADLVDKLGRAVVQREEAVREKTKLQSQLKQSFAEVKTLQDERHKIKRQMRSLEGKNDHTARKAQMRARDLVGKQGPQGREMPDESDDELERELVAFESRHVLLDEGAQGMNVLAETLQKEKDMLESTNSSQAEVIDTLESSVVHWKTLSANKERQLKELGKKYADVQKAQSIQAQQIAAKRKEIEDDIALERTRFEKHVSLLQTQCDDATSNAQGMQDVSDKMALELARVHETYAKQLRDKEARKDALIIKPLGGDGTAATGENSASETVAPVPVAPVPSAGGIAGPQVLASEKGQRSKTGQLLNIDVHQIDDEHVDLVVEDVDSGQTSRLPLAVDVLQTLDDDDPWPDLFGRVGFTTDGALTVATDVGPNQGTQVTLLPANVTVLLSIRSYGNRRFHFSATELETRNLLGAMVMEDSITPALAAQIDASSENLSSLLIAQVVLTKGSSGLELSFSATGVAANAEAQPASPIAPVTLNRGGNLEGSVTFMGMQFPSGCELEVLYSAQSQQIKTGQVLNIEVCRLGEEEVELRTTDLDTGHCHSTPLDLDLLETLDEDDPWSDLFGRTGFTSDGVLTVATDVGPAQGTETTLQPANLTVLLSIRSFGSRRFYFSGMDLATQRMVTLMVLEDSLSPAIIAEIDSKPENLSSLLFSQLSLTEGDAGLVLAFGTQA